MIIWLLTKVKFAYSEVSALSGCWESPTSLFSAELHQNLPQHLQGLVQNHPILIFLLHLYWACQGFQTFSIKFIHFPRKEKKKSEPNVLALSLTSSMTLGKPFSLGFNFLTCKNEWACEDLIQLSYSTSMIKQIPGK